MTAFRHLLLGLLVLAILASPVVAVLGGWIGGQHWPMKRLQVSAPFEFVGQTPVRAAVARHARGGPNRLERRRHSLGRRDFAQHGALQPNP